MVGTNLGRATRFQPQNRDALRHGLRADDFRRALLEDAAGVLAERRAAIVADLGGEDTVSVVRGDLVNRYLELGVMAEWLAGDLVRRGVFTARGRTRAAFGAFLSLVDRVHRLATAIGLERRPRHLPSLDEYLATNYGSRRSEPATPVREAPGDETARQEAER